MAITVFFEEDITEDQIDEIGEQLAGCEGVHDVEYVSADQHGNLPEASISEKILHLQKD